MVRFSLSDSVPGAELHDGEDVGTFATDWHFHEGWQLVALTQGERHYQLRDGYVVARPGQLVVLPPRLVHKARCIPGTSFKIAMVPVPGLEGAVPVTQSAPRLIDAFVSIFGSLAHEKGASVLSNVQEILAHSIPAASTLTLPNPVRRMESYILERTDQPLSLEALSSITGLSRSRMVHVFSEHVGLSPLAYHSRARLMRARALIAQGWSLSDTSAHLNYSDQSHFGRQFKRVYAMTPGQYQQSVLRGA